MYNDVLTTLFVAFAAATIGPDLPGGSGGTAAVKAEPTLAQANLVNRVFQEHHWPGLWFDSVADDDADDWMPVSAMLSPDVGVDRKLRKITSMMGCAYGLRLHWLISLAVYVVGECTYLSVHDHGKSVDCWSKTVDRVKSGSATMMKLMQIIAYVHRCVIDDVGDDDPFYRAMLPVRHAVLTQQPFRDGGGGGFLAFVETLKTVAGRLHRFMVDNCRPAYRPLVIEELMDEHETLDPRNYSYVFYIYKIDIYVLYIDDHLSRLGFRYIRTTGRAFFDPNS